MRRGGTSRHSRTQRGHTLVELLIGCAVALIVVATTSTTVVASLQSDRTMLIESRLMQDLRTAADVVSRDLRRSGYWGAAASGVRIDGVSTAAVNPYADTASGVAPVNHVDYRYSRDAVENGVVDSAEQFGYRLRDGTLEFQFGSGNWQALTDSGTVVIDAFIVTPDVIDIDLGALCDTPCPVVDAMCPPHQLVHRASLRIAGHAVADARVRRALQARVRVRNDAVIGACAS